MDMRKMIIELAGGPVRRLFAKFYIKNKSDDDLRELISSQKPKDVLGYSGHIDPHSGILTPQKVLFQRTGVV